LSVDTSNAGGEKLQKVLARAGLGSRRDMEKMISTNRVTVNGKVAHLGDRVEERDRILVDGHPIALKAAEERRTRVLIYNKPEGEICSARDPEGRPTVFQGLPTLRGERWISIGRLDFNTSGLLLFTTDGELANALMHPSSNIDREYLCRVLGEVDEDMQERLRRGIVLEDGIARFTDITEGGGSESSANRWFYVCLMEGRNREVRRLWESQEVKVSRLKRVRYGPVFLPSRLKQGQWQEMPTEQVLGLYELARLQPPAMAPLSPAEQQKLEREQRKNRPAQRGTPTRATPPTREGSAPRAASARAASTPRPRGAVATTRGAAAASRITGSRTAPSEAPRGTRSSRTTRDGAPRSSSRPSAPGRQAPRKPRPKS
jgi:23S rRNA pseudouridine2605 synthase